MPTAPKGDAMGNSIDSVERRYRELTPRSRALWDRACKVMPSGVSGTVKFFPPYPAYLVRAEGAFVWDLDGNEYVDLILGAGSHLLGHGHPDVQSAVRDQVTRINQHLSPSPLEVDMAEMIAKIFPYVERVRFANTGSEAIRSAVRIARAVTGRTMIAKVEGLYHGSDDFALVSAFNAGGPWSRPVGTADSVGIPKYVVDDVLILPFNDAEAASELIDEHGERLAAVLVEPIGFSTGGGLALNHDFARALRDATSRHGALLIFDEVATGLRLTGGAAAFLGVTPDLTCLGKSISSGYPLAAFGGRVELMERTLGKQAREEGSLVFQSGTFTANPVSLAAGIATLGIFLRESVVERADEAAATLRNELNGLFGRRGIEAYAVGASSILQVHFADRPPTNRRDILHSDIPALTRFLLGLLTEGVLWTPIHPAVTSISHTLNVIDRVLEAAERALGDSLLVTS
jgi:glutamate-1-semialdehyde 2,1-aminomutase